MKRNSSNNRAAERALLDYLQRPDYRPLAQRQLLHHLHVPPEERKFVKAYFDALLEAVR